MTDYKFTEESCPNDPHSDDDATPVGSECIYCGYMKEESLG